ADGGRGAAGGGVWFTTAYGLAGAAEAYGLAGGAAGRGGCAWVGDADRPAGAGAGGVGGGAQGGRRGWAGRVGGIGVPAGGVPLRPQWKMRVETVWTRLPACEPVPAAAVAGPLSTMVMTSPVPRALTW